MNSDPMSESDSATHGDETPSDIVSRVFGPDLWLRFDMWSGRAWEMTERAATLAGAGPAPISSDDYVFDPRVAAVFHAAENAKEFAAMCSPLIILGMGYGEGTINSAVEVSSAYAEMLIHQEDD